MSETKQATGNQARKRSSDIARQRRGGVPKELMELSREQARIRKSIGALLKRGPMTIPELHAATGIPAEQIFWYLSAWKKYGKIAEGDRSGDYYQYVLVEDEK